MRSLGSLLVVLCVACGQDDKGDPISVDGGIEPAGADAGDSETAGPSAIVFATSTRHDGNLGGPEGADAICAERASDAGLPGTFRAWLSTPSVSAAERLQASTIPYRRTDGVLVAADWNDLIDGELAAPIHRDEYGEPISGDVWTGTTPDGALAEVGCAGFVSASDADTGLCGNSNLDNTRWTANLEPACTTRLRLYCFEQ